MPHLHELRALPASSSLVRLKEPSLRSTKHWSPEHMVRQGMGRKHRCKEASTDLRHCCEET